VVKEKRAPEQHNRNLLLFLHTILWLPGWVIGIYLISIPTFSAAFVALVLLLWTLLFMIHLSLHYYAKGRSDGAEGERQAYRDGYNDAVRAIMNPDRSYEARRLMVETSEDDGELIDWQPQGKRKRE
jgi:hypothetical protein